MPNLKFSKKEYRGSILSFYSKVHGFNYEIVSSILTPVMKEISTFKSISGQKYEDVFFGAKFRNVFISERDYD